MITSDRWYMIISVLKPDLKTTGLIEQHFWIYYFCVITWSWSVDITLSTYFMNGFLECLSAQVLMLASWQQLSPTSFSLVTSILRKIKAKLHPWGIKPKIWNIYNFSIYHQDTNCLENVQIIYLLYTNNMCLSSVLAVPLSTGFTCNPLTLYLYWVENWSNF